MEEAEALCDRVCLIRDGVKVAEGTLEAVMAASGKSGLEEAIAEDDIAVIVNAENPLEDITLEELKNVFTGMFVKWEELNQ